MLIRLEFKDNKNVGYQAYNKEVYPYIEQKGIAMIEIQEEDLKLITGENWREESQKLILVDGEIKVDETWTPLIPEEKL